MIREKLAAKRSVEDTGFRWRGEVSRLEQFSDAVFAFALALLVVSIDAPTSLAEVLAILGDFPAFGLTFATLVWIWYQHYLFFRRYGLADPTTIVLNAVLLFLILFFVYPLKFLFSAVIDGLVTWVWAVPLEKVWVVMTIYCLGFVGVFGLFALLYRHALRLRDELELDPVEVLITRATLQANLLLVAIGLMAAAMAGLGPPWMGPVAGWFFFAIGPVMAWHWRRVERRRQALASSP